MSEQLITIINHANFEEDFLGGISTDIKKVFQLPVTVEASHLVLDAYFDPMRRQYDGNRLLMELDSLPHTGNTKTIALFRVDLFIPILTYIFGQAALGGKSGLASTYRLRNEHYGIKPDEALLLDRFSKVTIHELGHMFGLIHCHIPNCVMRSSTYVEDIDQKSHEFCKKCRETIGLA